MRVVLQYEDKLTIKVKLPKKWLAGTTEILKSTVVDQYNKKNAEHNISGEEFHLELENGTILCSDDIVQKKIPDRSTIMLVPGPSLTIDQAAAEVKRIADANTPVEDPNDPILTCRNFGCQKKYRESENHDSFCCHHKNAPVFHETAKYWSCCPNKKAYDWDTFMAIPGCTTGRCTTQGGVKTALGGSDVRAKAQESNEYAPKRLEAKGEGSSNTTSTSAPTAPVALSKGRVMTPLDKLSALRKTMVGIGVDGSQFDSARDTIKSKYESELGSDVWKKVCEEMSTAFTSALEKIEMQQETN
jgi:hypothetical protein